ncbi:MAG TPA: PLP-dependent aminotransferase family protein [Terriglobales bacterium]|jgi:GntR family transcriptional regulator/MocR family aminotransferase|nr:PLP-dependent aminotransferase family protein [Terriglobales bacterium]
MPKLATSLPLSLSAPSTGTPLYRWFYEELRSAILDRRIAPGARLPATRDLAREYKLARATVVAAFEQLQSEGYVEGRVGAGTYVSQVLPEDLLQAARVRSVGGAGPRRVRWSSYARRLGVFHGGEPRPVRAFRANLAALDAFPTTLWAQVASRRLRRASTQLLAGGEALGYRPLRQAVAEYLNASRGVKCSTEQVLIISGVQEALERAAHLLLDPGDPVWVEEPGYPGAAIVFGAVGAKVRRVPVNSEGLDLEFGRRRWRHAKLVYVTPAHQFPLGVTMSLRRRLALLEWARRSRTLIFEDDYDSEYRYSGRPIPALQGLDRAGVVIFAGSFNEVLFPALRLGYLVVPPAMVDRFAAGQSVSMRHAPLLDQAVLCDFITEGHFARHIRRMRELYAERLAVLLESSRSRLAGLLEIPNVEAGLQTVAWLAPGMRAARAAEEAAAHGVEVIALSRYSSRQRERHGLILGFAAVDSRELRRGVEHLARALERCTT